MNVASAIEPVKEITQSQNWLKKDYKVVLNLVRDSFSCDIREFAKMHRLSQCDVAQILFLRNYAQVRQIRAVNEINLNGTVNKYAQVTCDFLNRSKVDTFNIFPHHVENFISAEIEKGLAVNTINLKIRIIRSYFRYLCDSGMMTRNPTTMTRTKKGGRKCHEDHVLFPQEISTLLDSVARENTQDFLFLAVLRYAGVRVAEARDLCWADLSQNIKGSWWIDVTGKGNKRRRVNIPTRLAIDLLEYRNQKFGLPVGAREAPGISTFPIFGQKRDPGKKLHYEAIYRKFRKYVEKYLGKRASPHWLRHTFVTHLISQQVDTRIVNKIVGHASIATTLKYNQSYHVQGAEIEEVFADEYEHFKNG